MFSNKVKGRNFLRLEVYVVMLTALFWGFSSPTLAAPAEDKFFTEYFESGKEYLDRGRFEEAAKNFKESLRLNPHLDEIDEQVAKETQVYLERVKAGLERIEEARCLVEEERIRRLAKREQVREEAVRVRAEAEALRLREREERAAKLRAEREERERLVYEERAAWLREREEARHLAREERPGRFWLSERKIDD